MTGHPVRGRSRHLRSLAWHIWLPLSLLAIWFVASSASTTNFFPPLSAILPETWRIWVVEGAVLQDVVPSLLRLLAGLAIAAAAGVAFGTLFGLFPRLESAFKPLLDTLRAVPGAALLPIALMFFGTDEPMKIALIAFVSMWPILLNTIDGVRALDLTMRSALDSFHVKPMDRFFFAYLPSAAPQVFAGARVALSIGVAVMVVVEMFGTPGGVGYFIRASQEGFRFTAMWTGLIVLGIFGYALNALFRALEQRTLRWHFALVAHSQGGSS